MQLFSMDMSTQGMMMINHLQSISLLLVSCLFLTACNPTEPTTSESQKISTANGYVPDKGSAELEIKYEQYTLNNGLKVILHVDKSDPIVAMATVVHVGSNREKPGRTGFAHFFEHMSFNDSENVPKGANRKMIPELGGTRNGGTWSDGTIYYEVVPKDAFDKLLWIDSDRLGYMINTVDSDTLEREKQVVKNEKRQRVDNRAYGHTNHVIKKALYPDDHPYNWTVIGDLEDLQAATLENVRDFYYNYYIPSNATLVIAGDIDIQETKQKVERWFGEIKAGPTIEPIQPQPITLTTSKKLFHIDNFAKLPELRLTFPTIEQYTEDAYALDALAAILSEGKNAALYKVVVEDKKLAPSITVRNNSNEVTGTFTILVRGNASVKLDDVYAAIMESLTNFEKHGFTDTQLTKIKAEQEISFYYSIESILNKALQLGIYNEFAGSPDFIKQDITNITAVTAEQIIDVYNRYIKNKPAIITSFVPKDQQALVLTGSEKANVVEEQIKQGAEKQFTESDVVEFTKTPSKHDRNEPPLTELSVLKLPDIWQAERNNGLSVYGIEQTELPLVNFNLRINGGQALDAKDKLGSSFLLAQLMREGTKSKTPLELEEAIGLLGASLNIKSDLEGITISGNTLTKNFNATMDLLAEVLLEPRFDANEFVRLKSARLTKIKQFQGNTDAIAYYSFMKILYGKDHIEGTVNGGTEETVNNVTLKDLKNYYTNNLFPKQASFHIVGSIKQAEVEKALNKLNSWTGQTVSIPQQPQVRIINKPEIYFIDMPGAKQSVIYVGKTSVTGSDSDFYPIVVANNRLGQDMSSRLSQTLRIQKGYTYGVRSTLMAANSQSTFIASSHVRSNVTLESLEIFRDLIGNYKQTYGENDLAVTKNMIIKGNFRRFETLNQLLGMLNNISRYNRAPNYIEQQQDFVQTVKLESILNIIKKHLDEQQMIYMVVGDAETQLAGIKDLGYGKPVVLNIHGDPINSR